MVELKENSKLPFYVQLYRSVREDIVLGRYHKGEGVPSIRALALELGVSKNTVSRAYNQLAAEGYLVNHPQSGYIVSEISEQLMQKAMRYMNVSSAAIIPTTIQDTPFLKPQDQVAPPYEYDFTYHKMDITLLSKRKWRAYFEEALVGCDSDNIGVYGNVKGERELRIQISHYLDFSRNIKCDEEQIVLCCGINDCIEKLCCILPRTKVAIECPTLPVWNTVFLTHGFPVDAINLYPQNRYTETLLSSDAHIAVVTPSHQFPLGDIMPLKTRMELLDWAEERDGFIIEDDYDCEYRYASQPLSALYSLDQRDRVIYMGTFSKILMPGLRVSYVVLPKRLVPVFNRIYSGYPPYVAWVVQKALFYFMQNDNFIRYIFRARRLMKTKHEILVETCRKTFGDSVDIIGTDAGLHILLRVNQYHNDVELIQIAREAGVHVYSVREYWFDPTFCPDNVVLVGFSAIKTEDIIPGIKRLETAWHEKLHETVPQKICELSCLTVFFFINFRYQKG